MAQNNHSQQQLTTQYLYICKYTTKHPNTKHNTKQQQQHTTTSRQKQNGTQHQKTTTTTTPRNNRQINPHQTQPQ